MDENIYNELNNLLAELEGLFENKKPSKSLLINEEKGVTFYELRVFLTMLSKVSSGQVQSILKDLIKAIAKLEVHNIPIPTIPKLRSASPSIFKKIKR
jgi:hypothetical protein